jgi:hypothetical protein
MNDNKHKFCLALLLTWLALLGGCGKPQGRGVITGSAVPAEVVEDKLARQQNFPSMAGTASQILFGDLHVHTTFSPDAFIMSVPLMMSLMDFENREFYWGIQQYYDEVADTPVCDTGVDTRQLPQNCREIADDPRELFTKLDQWGFDSIVIPHGNSWGMNTPATTSFTKQLNRAQHDPDRQILFEVYSGHGNSEEYRG